MTQKSWKTTEKIKFGKIREYAGHVFLMGASPHVKSHKTRTALNFAHPLSFIFYFFGENGVYSFKRNVAEGVDAKKIYKYQISAEK